MEIFSDLNRLYTVGGYKELLKRPKNEKFIDFIKTLPEKEFLESFCQISSVEDGENVFCGALSPVSDMISFV